MTEPTIHGDHSAGEDGGPSNTTVRGEHSRTRAVVQIGRNGNIFYYADGDIDFLVVDERTPRDRVYALSQHKVAPAVIDELIGSDRIGRWGDMPGTEAAIRAFISASRLRGRNSLSFSERTNNEATAGGSGCSASASLFIPAAWSRKVAAPPRMPGLSGTKTRLAQPN
jgi:hypothetical protein